jgi:hypothetical protein
VPAYIIVETDVHDPEQYELYKRASPAAVAAGGGRFIALLSLGFISPGVVWVFATFAALVATLLSRPMREHVGFGNGSTGPRFLRAHRV